MKLSTYRIVYSEFWSGETGRMIRGNHDAQLVALYLLTCRLSNPIGAYHLPLLFIGHDLGMTTERVGKAIERLSAVGFLAYDHANESVWVRKMGAYQLGTIKATDKRHAGICEAVSGFSHCSFYADFCAEYETLWSLSFPQASPQFSTGGEGASQGACEARTEQNRTEQNRAEKARAVLDVYPKAFDVLTAGHLLDDHDVSKVVAGIKAWKQSAAWQEQGGRFVPKLEKFLADRQYEKPPKVPSKPHYHQPAPPVDPAIAEALRKSYAEDEERMRARRIH